MNNDNLKKIFGKINVIDASHEIYAQATYFPLFTKIFVPHRPIQKLIPWMEGQEPIKPKGSLGTPDQGNLERAMRRAKNKIRGIALTNSFDLFTTHTFAKDRGKTNDNILRERMRNWIKNEKKRKGKFQYLIVAERQKDSTLHFHGLLKDYKGELTPAINAKNSEPLLKKGQQVYNLKSYRAGYSTAKMIGNTAIDQLAVSGYITKYITKDLQGLDGKNRYWSSRDLRSPKTEDNPGDWHKSLTPIFKHTNEFGAVYYFSSADVDKARL